MRNYTAVADPASGRPILLLDGRSSGRTFVGGFRANLHQDDFSQVLGIETPAQDTTIDVSRGDYLDTLGRRRLVKSQSESDRTGAVL